MAFMTPSPASRHPMTNPNISATDRSLSQTTFNSSEYSDIDIQNPADQFQLIESSNDETATSVLDSLEYVSPGREQVLPGPEEDVSGNMICDDNHTQSLSDSGFNSEKYVDLHLKFTIYSQQGVNPARGPTAFKSRGKPKYFTHIFKGKKFAINLANHDLAILKAWLFKLSNKMGDKAEATTYTIRAPNDFFDPSKKEKQVELDISIGQHKLQARNLSSNVHTNESDLAHSTPEDPFDKAMAALMLKYSTVNNNTSKGWRVYKQDNLTKVMQLNFQQMDVWAKKMVTNPECVTVEIPPNMPGFQWVDLKNPLILQTLTSNTKQPYFESHSKFQIGGIDKAQGYDIELDPYNVERVHTHATLEEYMASAGV
ncbi:hypothetical protein DFH28DRAFT_1129212 [Melampsora americana]|nr:hypothetical protein DFH28DRAFT_1129212 [Melampsora americana]